MRVGGRGEGGGGKGGRVGREGTRMRGCDMWEGEGEGKKEVRGIRISQNMVFAVWEERSREIGDTIIWT